MARYAFECGRSGGPGGVAQQYIYKALFVPEITEKGFLVLTQILEALIEKTVEENKMKEFMSLLNSLSKEMPEERTIKLIDYTIQIIRE